MSSRASSAKLAQCTAGMSMSPALHEEACKMSWGKCSGGKGRLQ